MGVYNFKPRKVNAAKYNVKNFDEIEKILKLWECFSGTSINKDKTKVTIFYKAGPKLEQRNFVLLEGEYLVYDFLDYETGKVESCQVYEESLFKSLFEKKFDDEDGEEDDSTDYEKIVENIKTAPMTWIPALLVEVLTTAHLKKCFKGRKAMLEFAQAHLKKLS